VFQSWCIRFEDITPEQMLPGLLAAGLPRPYAEFLNVILGYFKAGYSARITDAVSRITGRAPRAFAEYARDHRAPRGPGRRRPTQPDAGRRKSTQADAWTTPGRRTTGADERSGPERAPRLDSLQCSPDAVPMTGARRGPLDGSPS